MSLSDEQSEVILFAAQEHGITAILALLAAYAADTAGDCEDLGGATVVWHRTTAALSTACADINEAWDAERATHGAMPAAELRAAEEHAGYAPPDPTHCPDPVCPGWCERCVSVGGR